MARKRTHEEYLEELSQKGINLEPLEEYQGSNIKIPHRCSNNHVWEVRPCHVLSRKPTKVLSSNHGCPYCVGVRRDNSMYLDELKKHGILHEPLEEYQNSLTKILHRCPSGHEWSTTPSRILQGHGCPICYGNVRKTTAEYCQELLEKSIDATPLEPYKTALTKLLHRCSEGHEWSATPHNILRGSRCPECAKHGFNPEKPAILYYLKVDEYYKIGITNNTVAKRFFLPEDKEKITVLFEKHYERGQDARDQEKAILEEFADYRIHVPGLLRGGGNTELFTEDVLQLDKKGP